MPKFWAKDYLSEALKEQRAVVERMSLAPPAHIEIVDCYAHKGEVDDIHHTMPWMSISPDADYNLQVCVSTTHLEPLHSELKILTASGSGRNLTGGHWGAIQCVSGGTEEGVERYEDEESGSESLFSDDGGGEREAESSGLTQEIDSAVERIMSSLMSSPGIGGRSHTTGSGEEFAPENLQGWEMNTTIEVAELYLEEHESSPHLSSLLSTLPSVADLVARLKPKLISDPLLSPSTSRPYSYMQVCRSDFKFCVSDSVSEEDAPINDVTPSITARNLDHFQREMINDSTSDPVLELHVASPPHPLLQSSPNSDSSLLPPLPQLPSPVREEEGEEEMVEEEEVRGGDEMGDALKTGKELRMLVSECCEGVERRQDQQLHFTSPTVEKMSKGTANFLELNNADVSRDSEDSGIGHAVLESPCVPLSSPPSLPSSSLPAQLAYLEPMPVSPATPHKLVLLSPGSEERLLNYLQEESRAFDSVLALTLPYSSCSNHVDDVMKNYSPLHIVRDCSDVQPINLSGDSELALPWDPLASAYHLMTAVQRALVCLQCPLNAEDSEVEDKSCFTESFVADATVKALLGIDTTLGIGDGGDVPSLHAAPSGYLKARQLQDTSKALDTTPRCLKSIDEKRKSSNERLLFEDEGTSPLDMFIMLRSGTLSPEIAKSFETSSEDGVKETEDWQREVKVSPDEKKLWVKSPTVQDVFLDRDHQTILSKVANCGIPLVESLRAHGLPITRDTSFSSLEPDDAKFFLKQQQKCLADSQTSKEKEILLESCRLAACLYVLVSFANGVANINITTGIRRFTFLHERYEELIGGKLDIVKQGLADIQVRETGKQRLHHPKLHSVVSVVNTWKTSIRKHTREKVIVVVGNDFDTVSGNILDFLKSISDLKSCVFSFTCESTTNPLYLETLEERFHYYDCLVMPLSSIISTFPWEKVSLLVEYQPLGATLFPDGQPTSLRLKHWIVLKTAHDVSATSLAKSGSRTCSRSSVLQYTLIASENVTTNAKLLQLLESRFNLLLVSREYDSLRKKMGSGLSYADLIVDEVTGITVHPLSVLSSDPGVHSVSTRAAALSLQYERLWILLYAESENSYPYGGSVPLNLARLHASVAHYSPRQDAYQVKVMCVSGQEELAHLVRSIVEETREAVNEQHWNDREWIADDLENHEKFLLSFPCLNSFSAQAMLRACPLRQLLTLSAAQLQELLPWLPLKVLQFFSKMCHANFQQSLPSDGASEYWENSRDAQYYPEAPAASLDDSLQYAADEPPTVWNDQPNAYHNEESIPFSDGMAAFLPSEDDTSLMMGGTSHPFIVHEDVETDPALPDTGPSFQLPNDPLVQDSVLRNDAVPVPLVSETSQQSRSAAGSVSNFSSETLRVPTLPNPSLFDRHATLSVPSQREIRSSVLPKLSVPSGHHFAIAENMSREYYGSDPMAPRLLTSGMVRRTPSREPIKSLDSDLDVPSTAKGPQPYLKTNDRTAALNSKGGCDNGRRELYAENVLASSGGNNSGWRRNPVQGMAELMAFHSRQRRSEGVAGGSILPTDLAIGAKGSKIRQKRPFPSSPVFDCQVPSHAQSPHGAGESSLYASPNVSLGSFKLSPVRKRRLVYKRLPNDLDGQTKLVFE